MNNGKLIREVRLGPPMAFKTGAVVGTYPKPMLVCNFQDGGLGIIPSRSVQASIASDQDLVKMDVCAEELVYDKPENILTYLTKPRTEQPKVLVMDFAASGDKTIDMLLKPNADSSILQKFVDMSNKIYQQAKTELPWATIVIDPVSQLTEATITHIAKFQPAAMNDARQWAAQAGQKVWQVFGMYLTLPCHVVFIMHTELEKHELSGSLVEVPMLPSKLKFRVTSIFPQALYAVKRGRKAMVATVDSGFTRGIGVKWPAGLPAECPPDFKSIYGKEIEV